jgi:polysaccharide pyruvyl transferase WcaK-like protein
VSESSYSGHKPVKIALLGASLETGNLGVSALAESSIKIILNRWPDADIVLLRSGREVQQQNFLIMGKEISLWALPIRFSKNIFLPYHFLRYVFYGLLAKVLPRSQAKDALLNRKPYFRTLYQTDFVADITGGDSFSDIYGFRRFFFNFLCKWLVLMCNKDLIMLPQTYGPFKRAAAKAMAKYILRKSKAIYSRDKNSADYAKMLLGNQDSHGKVHFCPDVAFLLDARRPEKMDIGILEEVRKKDTIVVGLNVSGLLYNGGYTRDNMFGLKVDYRELVGRIIELLLSYENTVVLLVPHVFVPFGAVESDTEVCQIVYDKLLPENQQKVMIVKGDFEAQEIKYVIGLCDFFVGSRMHSCIAALSQCVPAVGLAYSDKFEGVFETAQNEQYVLDMRNHRKDEILKVVLNAFEERKVIRNHLQRIIPGIQNKVMNLFEDIGVR